MRLVLMILFILSSLTESFAEPKRGSVELYLESLIAEQVKLECQTCQVDVFVHNPNVIADIVQPDKVIADRWRGQTNLLLQLGDKHRVVTVTIRWYDQVIVASKNIKQGQLLSKKHLRSVKKDVTFQNASYSTKINSLIGLKTQRVFQRGQVIDEAYLKKPLAILYGQPVKALIEDKNLQLIMTARAKGAGAIGERVPIFIPETKKRLSGVIVNKNTVRVE